MDMQKNWWDLTGCGSHYIEDAIDNLSQSNSICLLSKEKLPWIDYFYEKIKSANISSSKAYETIDAEQIKNPEEYIFSRYCSPDVQSAFWPENSQYTYANFLAERDDIVLNYRFLIVHNICTEKDLRLWCDFIIKYNKCVAQRGVDPSERAVFILEYVGENLIRDGFQSIKALLFCPREVDILTYNLINTAHEYTEYILNKYAAELIGDICGGNIEKCGYMAKINGVIKNPIATISEYAFKNPEIMSNVSEDRILITSLSAQFKVFLPFVEQKRKEVIEKYSSSISRVLPWQNDYGEGKIVPYDMELRDLIFKAKEIGICEEDKKILDDLKEIRNKLAHNHTIYYDEILNIVSITV